MAEDYGDSGSVMQVMSPSGIQEVSSGEGVNDPIAVSTGTTATGQQVLSGTQKNTPPGPAIFKWNKYDFMWNAYWGTGGFYDGTVLRKQLTEEDDQYLLRRAMCYYRNFVQPIIDATYKPVFNDGITREVIVNKTVDKDGTLTPFFHGFMDNVDNRNNSIGEFAYRVVKNVKILDVCFVIIDNFPNIPATLDRQTALDKRIFPFAYIRFPQQVEECLTILNDFGKIQQIAFKENPEDYFDGKRKVSEKRWKKWTPEYSVKLRYNEKTSEYEELPGTYTYYDLGEVPVIAVKAPDSEDGTVLPHPSFYNIARCNWSIFNQDSGQTRAINGGMFPILIRPQPQGYNSGSSLAINPLQGLTEPPAENGVTPAQTRWLPYPVQNFEAISEFMKGLIDDLYRQAGQLGVVTTTSKTQSGLSKGYDFHALHFVLKGTAKLAKGLEEEIARIFKLYVKDEIFEYNVHYEEDYAPDTNPDDDVNLYTSYIDMGMPPKLTKLAKKMASLSVFDDADEKELTEALEELDQMAVEESKNRRDIPPEDDSIVAKGDDQVDITPEDIAAMAAAASQDEPPKKQIKKSGKKSRYSLRGNE